MEITLENIENAEKDIANWKMYLEETENKHPMIIAKSFKQMYGYEIILFENGEFELKGERNST